MAVTMACETLYVKSVRKAVNTATRQWELRGDGCAFNKLWLTHHEVRMCVWYLQSSSLIRHRYRSTAAPLPLDAN